MLCHSLLHAVWSGGLSGEGEGEWAPLQWGGAIKVEWKSLGHSAELK